MWIWSDGSAGGVTAEGSGAFVVLPSGEEQELRVPADSACSSTHAELVAPRVALDEVQRMEADPAGRLIVACTDSQAALATLASGAGAQTTALGAAIRRLLLTITEGGRLQWIPARFAAVYLEMRRRTRWLRRPPACRRTCECPHHHPSCRPLRHQGLAP